MSGKDGESPDVYDCYFFYQLYESFSFFTSEVMSEEQRQLCGKAASILNTRLFIIARGLTLESNQESSVDKIAFLSKLLSEKPPSLLDFS